MTPQCQKKLEAARTRLILDTPFLGALVLRLPLVAADPTWCPTTATDARRLFFNAAYIDALDVSQTQFVLAHEALHCALSHFARREHRVKRRWDVACDYAVNPLLVGEGLTPPPNALIEDTYAEMTAEEIYPFIQENTADAPMDGHVYEGEDEQGRRDHNGRCPAQAPNESEDDAPAGGPVGEAPTGGAELAAQPAPLAEAERATFQVQWQQRLASAAQQAMAAGRLGGNLARLVDHLLQPRLPWRALLARYMTAVARDDFSYLRPARREGSAILPSLRSRGADIVVALDTSGSISSKELATFLSEIDAIKGQVRARITLLACDAALAPDSPNIFEPWEACRLPKKLGGGGGTRFTPVFEWVAQQDTSPELLVYFTDANGEFPDHEPAYPILWLVKGRQPVPWGARIQLN